MSCADKETKDVLLVVKRVGDDLKISFYFIKIERKEMLNQFDMLAPNLRCEGSSQTD